MNLCRVSIEEAAHDQPVGKYQRARSHKTTELLDGRFDPFSDDNFQLFFSDELSSSHYDGLLKVRDALTAGSIEHAGQLLRTVLIDYYTGLARIEAQDQIDNAGCANCFDIGCPACSEMEVE